MGVLVDVLIDQTRYVTAVFHSRRDIEPEQYEVTWDELCSAVGRHRVYDSKHAAWLWSPTVYREGARRGRDGVRLITLLVADVDDGTSREELRFWLRAAQTAYLISSTWSHTPRAPRYRVVVPLLAPIPVEAYDDVWRCFNQHVLHGHIDPSTKDPSRMYYAPGCSFERREEVEVERFDDAPPLDWSTFPPIADLKITREMAVHSQAPRSELEHRTRCLIGKWIRELGGMAPGSGRHNAVRSKAVAMGGLVAEGLIDAAEATGWLLGACEQNGLLADPGGAAEKTIQDGLSYGARYPWTPDDLPDSVTWRARLESPRLGQKKAVSSSHPLRGELPTRFHTAREIAAQALPDVAWIARPWIAEGGLTEVDGKVKAAGKTTWLLALIRCVLEGEAFMNQPTTRTPVVLLSEQAPRSLQQAVLRAGLEERDDLHVLMWHETRDLQWAQIVEIAAEQCREVGARLLAIDTLSQFVGLHGDSENHSGDALVAVQPLQAVIARDGLGVIFNRHERKSGGDVGDSGRGSSAYAGAVDIIISLRRAVQGVRPTVRHLHALSRFDETPATTVIELQGMRYVALGDEATVTLERAEQVVLATLGSEDEALSQRELQLQVSVRRTELLAALSGLLASGRVRRLGTGKRGDAYRYFRAGEDDDADL